MTAEPTPLESTGHARRADATLPTKAVSAVRRWWNGRTRMVVFVFGGLLVLQRSDTLDAPKLVYFAAAAAVVLSALIVMWRSRETQDFARFRPWIAISVAFGIMIVVSLPVAAAHGVGFTPWLRGVAAYGLFAVAPLVAFDARRVMSTREAVGWMTVAGALAAISFSIYWLQYRKIADLGIGPLVLPSAQLAFAGFAVTVAFSFRSRRPVPWAVAGGLILGALLVTGTRTTLLACAVPAVLAIVAGRSQWKQTGLALIVGAATASLMVALTIVALSNPMAPPGSTVPPGLSATPRPELIGERLGSIGTLLTDPASGQSLTERIAQSQAAFDAFAADPLLGSGPGRMYVWTDSSGRRVESYSLDTPISIAAAFGLLGILVCLALVGVFGWFIRFYDRTIRRGAEYLCVVGLAVSFGLTSLLGPPMDDKGAAYALALVLTIALPAAVALTAHAQH